MKLFNLDLHVGVIGDVKNIFNTLYGEAIQITSWSISGHRKMFGLGPEHVDVVNDKTWANIDEDMVYRWNCRYGWYMQQFDGFIVTHSPVFAMLYERYNKPIICVNSCRYDLPYCWTKKPNNLNAALRRMTERKQLIIISNNRNDHVYIKEKAGIITPVIPSICQYIGVKHQPTRPEAVLFGNTHYGRRELFPAGNYLVVKPANYKYKEIMEYKCIVHVPYDTSTMSNNEHYFAGCPMMYPTKRFYKQCIKDGSMEFNHLYGVQFTEAQLDECLEIADYYTYPYITYYDSYEQVKDLVENFVDTKREERMKFLEETKLRVYGAWRNTLPFGRK